MRGAPAMRETVTREHPTENHFLAILRAFGNRTAILAASRDEGLYVIKGNFLYGIKGNFLYGIKGKNASRR